MKALLFDLDDTLYSEREFVASGFRAVARHAGGNWGLDERQVFRFMMYVFASGGRRRVLPALVSRFLDPSVSLSDLVRVYRDHAPRICLFPGYSDLLRRLRRRFALGVITDGHPAVQRRKVAALGLEGLLDRIVYTWDHGEERGKPHPHAFSLMLDALGAGAADALHIGDNPSKDGEGARRAGIRFVHLGGLSGSRASHSAAGSRVPEFRIDSLHQLPALLSSLG